MNELDELVRPWKDLAPSRRWGLIVAVGVVAGFIAATVSVVLDARLLLTLFPSMIVAFAATTVVLVRRTPQAP